MSVLRGIRVEPKAASHVFVVHGQACLKTPQHPTCSHTKEGTKPAGKIYVIDLKPIMGVDWRVRFLLKHQGILFYAVSVKQ